TAIGDQQVNKLTAHHSDCSHRAAGDYDRLTNGPRHNEHRYSFGNANTNRLFPRRALRSQGAPSPAKPAVQPPQPTATAMYCRPSSVYVIGEAWCPEPHWKLHKTLPVSAS